MKYSFSAFDYMGNGEVEGAPLAARPKLGRTLAKAAAKPAAKVAARYAGLTKAMAAPAKTPAKPIRSKRRVPEGVKV